jgi:predicted RNA-binding protein with PUA domain
VLTRRELAFVTTVSDIRMATPGKVRHEIEVRIGLIERVLAGEYLDSLLVTVAAQ